MIIRQSNTILFNDDSSDLGGNTLTRGIFRVSEILGKFTAFTSRLGNAGSGDELYTKSTAITAEFMFKKIKEEYEAIFWATGNMDVSLWETNCTFSDPFSSFGGPGSTARFRENANNLGKLVKAPKLRITSSSLTRSADGSSVVVIGWIYSSKLKLPWNPVLAASGETSHYLSADSGRIFRYEERWKSRPWDVVGRLFVPTSDRLSD